MRLVGAPAGWEFGEVDRSGRVGIVAWLTDRCGACEIRGGDVGRVSCGRIHARFVSSGGLF